MPESQNNRLVPPSEKTVRFLYKGLVLFYPESVFGPKEGKKRPVVDYWTEGGYRRTEFANLLWSVTKTEDTDEAAKIVVGWKKLADENQSPEATVPENLDEMLSSLEDDVSGEKKLGAYNKQDLVKKSLLESQKSYEQSIQPEATIEEPREGLGIKAAGPLTIFAGNLLTAPFKAAVYLSGPTTYSSKAEGEGPGVATARYMLSHGISSSSIRALESRAQQLGITTSQLKNLARLIKAEQEKHAFSYKWVSLVNSGQKARLSQAQIASLLTPSSDGSTAVVKRKSLVGSLFGRIGQQIFGKITSRALKEVGKKVAGKVAAQVAATTASQATATAVAPIIGNLVVAAGQFIVSKIKDLISHLKTEEGREKVLVSIFTVLVISGIVIGGPIGAVLVAGGLVPGVGALVLKTGGFGSLGSTITGYGQAFVAGLLGVLVPTIGLPLIIAVLGIPLLIAIIILVINSGAYVVPPSPSQVPGAIESPYIGVEKEADPTKMDNPSGQVTISYSVRVYAKKGTLTNVQIANEYKVISEGNPPVPNPSVDAINDPPQIISPTDDYEFQYQITVGPEHRDSVVVDTITVVADAPEQQGATARESASVVIGNPPMHCPVPGGYQTWGSYTPGNETTGHGSNAYWNGMGSRCAWRLPQGVCWGPSQSSASSNYCYGRSGSCDFYGYALDVFPTGTNDVYAPTVDGKSVTWSYAYSFQNPGSGWSHIYQEGPYYIVFTHLNPNAVRSTVVSGERIGELFPQGGNTHLHLEFSINGQYQRPEEYFCF